MKKSIIKITTILLLSVVGLTSCHKTVTKRKLDGEWTLTSGSSTSSNTNNGVTTTSTITYTDSKATTTSGGESKTIDHTMSLTFDKKAGTYTMVKVSTTTETNTVVYFEQGSFMPYTMDQKDVAVTTYTENGTFTITGGTGEIEKNTQIVLLPTGTTTNTVHTYTYYEDGTSTAVSPTGKYTTYGGSKQYPTTETNTETTTETNSNGAVLTVTSLKKGVMDVEMNTTNTEVAGAETTSYTNNNSYTFTEKKK